MTPLDITHRWTWSDGSDRTSLPDWLDRHHHWHHDRPVIHTIDGPRTLYHGWIVAQWTDGAITVGSTTVADRVYGPDGLAGRLARAEAELAGVRALNERWVKAGPPPLGQSTSRWWDKRLVELGAALARQQQDARPEPEDLTGAYTPDPPIGCLTPAEETRLAQYEKVRLAQSGIHTPGCTCGHTGMGVSWHADDCPWRSGIVDCPGRPTPG